MQELNIISAIASTCQPGARFDGDPGNPDGTGTGDDHTAGLMIPVAQVAELDQDTRDWLAKRHVKDDNVDLAGLAKQARELDSFAGSAIQMPKEGASAEEWNAFYAKLGRPEDATGYGLAPPEGLPENTPYDQAMADGFTAKAFELGLSAQQAKGLHDWFAGTMGEATTAITGQASEKVAAVIEAANTTLEKAWGPKDSDAFSANVELASRALNHFDKDGTLKRHLTDAGMIGENGEVLVGPLALMLAGVGTAMVAEGGSLEGGLDVATAENPFADDTFNLTRAMAIAKSDPTTARQLATAAGADLNAFGLQAA